MWKKNQKIISRTEPDLGVGSILNVLPDGLLEVFFPKSDQKRTYSLKSGALQRYQLRIGQKAYAKGGSCFIVRKIENSKGYIKYLGDETGLWEYELGDSKVEDHGVLEQFFSGHLTHHNTYDLRREAWELRSKSRSSEVKGMIGPRISLLPHQLYVCNSVIRQECPRVLLADEVGLGKTIEAGLIFSSLKALGRASRVLIIVPEPLIHQWLAEMYRRFNELFTLLDEARCIDEEDTYDKSPFLTNQRIICSIEFLLKQPERVEQAEATKWDMLIIDEAHHLHWMSGHPDPKWFIVESLSRKSKCLLLLTATPRLYGLETLFGLLNLVDPERFNRFDTFCMEGEKMRATATLAKKLYNRNITPGLIRDLKSFFIDDEQIQSVLSENNKGLNEAEINLILKSLIDRHGTGRVFYRNRRNKLKGFPVRELHSVPLKPDIDYYRLLQKINPDEIDDGDLMDLATGTLSHLIAGKALVQNPRIDWLLKFVHGLVNEKVLIICSTIEQVMDLEQHIKNRSEIKTATFHEELSIVERDCQAASFSNPNGAQLLICSEIGGEGRNFQFVHKLVLFDLPEHPDLVEQRIGRLDRIGQTDKIEIFVPWLEDSPEEVLFTWYNDGLDSFKTSWNGTGFLMDKFCDDLFYLFRLFLQPSQDNSNRKEYFDVLISKTREAARLARKKSEESVDILLDLNSFDEEEGNRLVEIAEDHDDDPSLELFLCNAFDHYGVDFEDYDNRGSLLIRPGSMMFIEKFPGLKNEEDTIFTFDRDLALEREEIVFMTLDHGIAEEALSLLLERNEGIASICKWQDSPLGRGAIIELSVVLDPSGPQDLELDRYLPLKTNEYIFNHKGEFINESRHKKNPDLLFELNENETQSLGQIRQFLEPIIENALRKSEEWAKEQVRESIKIARARLLEEQARIEYLSKINPNVTEKDVKQNMEKTKGILDHLKDVKPRLDSIRLILTS